MSWSFSITPQAREQFAEAVDLAVPMGQDPSLPGVAEDVMAAKQALKALSVRVKRPFIGATAGGHCLQPSEGTNWSDSVNMNVYGVETLPPQ